MTSAFGGQHSIQLSYGRYALRAEYNGKGERLVSVALLPDRIENSPAVPVRPSARRTRLPGLLSLEIDTDLAIMPPVPSPLGGCEDSNHHSGSTASYRVTFESTP